MRAEDRSENTQLKTNNNCQHHHHQCSANMFLKILCQFESADHEHTFDKFLLQLPTSTAVHVHLLHRLLRLVCLRQQVLFIVHRITSLLESRVQGDGISDNDVDDGDKNSAMDDRDDAIEAEETVLMRKRKRGNKSNNNNNSSEGDVAFLRLLQDWMVQLVEQSKLHPVDAELLRTDDALLHADIQDALDQFGIQCDNYIQLINRQLVGGEEAGDDDDDLSADMVRWLKVTLLAVRNMKNDQLRRSINESRREQSNSNRSSDSDCSGPSIEGVRLSLFGGAKVYDGKQLLVNGRNEDCDDALSTLGKLVNASNEKTKVDAKLIISDMSLITYPQVKVDGVTFDKYYPLFDSATMERWMQRLSQQQKEKFAQLQRTDSFFAANNFLQPQRKRMKTDHDDSKPIYRRPLKIHEKYLMPVEKLELISTLLVFLSLTHSHMSCHCAF